MPSSQTQWISSRKRRIASFSGKIKTFINTKCNNAKGKVKQVIGISLERINYAKWKDDFSDSIIDVGFTALIIAFIIYAFTEGLAWHRLLAKGLAASLLLLLLIQVVKRVKEAVK